MRKPSYSTWLWPKVRKLYGWNCSSLCQHFWSRNSGEFLRCYFTLIILLFLHTMNIAKWERSDWMRPKVNSWQVGVSWGYQMVPTNCIITLSKNTFQNTSNYCKTFQNNSKHDECSKLKVPMIRSTKKSKTNNIKPIWMQQLI